MKQRKPEVWKSIVGYPHYEVSSHGRVRSIDRVISGRNYRSKVLATHITPEGYVVVSIMHERKRLTKSVHVLVAEHFCTKSDPSHVVNHLDGNRSNNYYENLEYATQADNVHHGASTMLTEADVLDIRARYTPRVVTMQMLADEYNVTKGCISDIIRRRRWSDL